MLMKTDHWYRGICEKCVYYGDCLYDVDCEALKTLIKISRIIDEDLFSNITTTGDE